jgi:hypothetical protein
MSSKWIPTSDGAAINLDRVDQLRVEHSSIIARRWHESGKQTTFEVARFKSEAEARQALEPILSALTSQGPLSALEVPTA